MQFDVGHHIVQLFCVECCVKLLEFAHASACVCVSCCCASDAHDFFVECFIGCLRSMRRRRVTVTRELQHEEVIRPRCAFACNVVGSDPVDDGRSGQSDPRCKIVFTILTDDPALRHFTQLPSSCGHVIKSVFFGWFIFTLPLPTHRPQNLSVFRADLVQLVFQRLA